MNRVEYINFLLMEAAGIIKFNFTLIFFENEIT